MGLFKKNKTEKTYYLFHESGLEGFPRTATKVIFNTEEENLTFTQLGLKTKVCIPLENVTSCEKYTEKELKEKSVIGRAVVGGILFGGVGAAVGAISGTKPKEKTLFYTAITYTDNNEEKTLLFKIEQLNSLDLVREIQELIKK